MPDPGRSIEIASEPRRAERPLLLFRLGGSVYGIPVHWLREITALPELKPAAVPAPHLTGIVNFRGEIVLVVDLDARLGRGRGTFSVDDKLVVLQQEEDALALIVQEVFGVRKIAEQELVAFDSAEDPSSESRFVEKMAKLDDQIVVLLDVARLFEACGDSGDETDQPEGDWEDPLAFLTEAGPEELAELRTRAAQLMRPMETGHAEGNLAVAVVEIADELVALPFDSIREFSEVRLVTPVPCCPPHIVGNVNLRGDILTVIDIRGALGLPLAGTGSTGKVVVVQTDEHLVGILVDALRDAITLRPHEILAVPSGTQTGSESFVKGTAKCGEEMMSILDLPRMLASDDWVVNEDVALK